MYQHTTFDILKPLKFKWFELIAYNLKDIFYLIKFHTGIQSDNVG